MPAPWRIGSRPCSGFISLSPSPREKSTRRWSTRVWRMISASAQTSGLHGAVSRSAWGLWMREAAGAPMPVDQPWQSRTLDDVNRLLLARPWARETLLRGSLARGAGDTESDIDLVAITADAEF